MTFISLLKTEIFWIRLIISRVVFKGTFYQFFTLRHVCVNIAQYNLLQIFRAYAKSIWPWSLISICPMVLLLSPFLNEIRRILRLFFIFLIAARKLLIWSHQLLTWLSLGSLQLSFETIFDTIESTFFKNNNFKINRKN